MTREAPIAFGFDFDHTLGVDNALERRAMYAYAAELGRELDPNDDAMRARIEALLAVFRAGEITMDEMIRRFAVLLGVPAAPASAERWREHCYALVDELVRPIDGAVELLASLRARGIPRAILTNGWTPLQQKKIARALGDEALGMQILVSDAIRAVKPERAAFDALVAALGVPRERILYVGDNARGDAGGALAAGLRAVWFDWEGQSYPQDLPPPTLTIHALGELEALVENTIAP
ncbi:MAG TPA: HAD family hydrolase [Candidatus Elarobacter sp.]|jgi:FMN phosphatase YigB (HAD superfamily)|nr:HAD family hydrolase [Candidatus Elarobacter sp.]